MFTDLIESYRTKKTSHLHRMHPELYAYLVDGTSFLPSDVTTTQRLWHFWNNQYTQRTCQCGNLVSWDAKNQTYRPFCSKQCAGKHRERDRTSDPICPVCNTNARGWNTTTKSWNATCSPACSQQMKSSLNLTPEELAEWISDLPTDFDYRTVVSQHRAAHNSIMAMTAHLPSSYQIKKRIQWINNEISTKRETTRAKLAALNITDDGRGMLEQIAEAEMNKKGNTACLHCRQHPRRYANGRFSKFCSDQCKSDYTKHIAQKRQRLTEERELRKLMGAHNKNHSQQLNDPVWLREMHYDKKLTKQQIAAMVGVDKETVTNRFRQFGIESVRHTSNGSELALLQYIQTIYSGEVITNTRAVIPPKELDIYIPAMKVAIEFCGLYWHSDTHNRIDRQYHKRKTDACEKLGIRLITLFEDEWLLKQQIVKDKIAHILNCSTKKTIYGRHTDVVDVLPHDRKTFLDATHIQGDGRGSVTIGLKHADELVAVMAFVKTAPMTWVLNRYATSCTVTGGFTKLLSYFKKHYAWDTIVSFADRRWSSGSVYAATGFDVDSHLPPDYKYLYKGKLVHKFNFRHKFLKSKLPQYDPTLSETQNTMNHNIHRVWDCGKIRYIMRK